MIKILLFLLLSASSWQSYSQVNRFSKPVTPARYQARSFTEIAAPYIIKKKNDEALACQKLLNQVKKELSGTSYESPDSEAISQVTFYSFKETSGSFYFAIVCFNTKSYGCDEYIYAVGPNTEIEYRNKYRISAGEAFWESIQPYHDDLPCSLNIN